MKTNIRHLDFDNEDMVEEFLREAKTLLDFDLTQFQIRYVKARTEGNNKRQSAIIAGSTSSRPEQIGSELEIKNDKIRLAIHWYGSKALQAAAIDKQTLVEMALGVFQGAMEENELEIARKTVVDLANMAGLMQKGVAKVPQGASKGPKGKDEAEPFQEHDSQMDESGGVKGKEKDNELDKAIKEFTKTMNEGPMN